MSKSNEEQHRRYIMEALRQAVLDGDLIEVRKYMCVVKQTTFPFKELEKALKPMVYWAAKSGQVEVLKELIERYKCDPRYTTERGHTLLYVACARGHQDVARYLAGKHGVNPNQRNNQHSTPLFAACNNGHLEAMVLLIDELKCDPRVVNSKGESLLHRASGGGHLEVVKCLITKYNLDPEARSEFKDTPLHGACANGQLLVVRYLIETHHCKTEVFNQASATPLHIVCRNGNTEGHAEVVHYLVMERNCNTILYDNSGSTPLHLACRYRRKEVVRVLLDSGKVDPNLPTVCGEAPISIARDPDIIRYLIRSGAKPVGRMPEIFERYERKAPLDSLVHVFMIGHSEAGKSTLAQALQMPVTSSLGGLITRANTVASDIPRTAGIIPTEFISSDFGRVLLYDFAGHPEFHASHGALLEHFNTSTAPLFLLVVDLNEEWEDVVRKTDYWLSFVENHRLPGVSPPRVMVIGSHQDELKKKNPEKCAQLISALEAHVQRRLKQSRLCLDGYFAIDCREPKKHRELRQSLKRSCDSLRHDHGIDSCCHVLSVFLAKSFDKKKLSCTIDEIIQKAKMSEEFPIPMQASRLCDLAEELSTRTKILFLRNRDCPEKSWIVLDIDTLLKEIHGCIFASESLPEHRFTPTHTGVLPWSQIERHLPHLDTALVVSFLGRLEFCQVVKDPEVLSLIGGKSDTSSVSSNEEELTSPMASNRPPFYSQTSSCSVQTGVSILSTSTSRSSVFQAERDGLPTNWLGNLYGPNTSPQHPNATANDNHELINQHGVSEPVHTTATTAPSNAQLSQPMQIPPNQIILQQNLKNHNGVPPSSLNNHVQSPATAAVSPTIIATDPAPSIPPLSSVSFPPHPSSLSSPVLSPVIALPSSLPPGSPHNSEKKKKYRQASSPPRFTSQASMIHDQLHNHHHHNHQGMTAGSSEPSLPEEQTWPARQCSIHRSPSDSCTLSSAQHHQHYRSQARSQGSSPRISHHISCAQSPVQTPPCDQYLFFPGLVNSGQPSGEMWLKDETFVFYSGWCLKSAKSHKFFTPRFLQTLILRLAFGFAVSRPPNGDLTNSMNLFSRECTIWKNGLRWLNLDGVETFVELVEDGSALLLLMRAKKGSEMKGVNLRSALIRKILDTKQECCPSLVTAEYLIDSKHLKERESYPIITKKLRDLTTYDVNLIARSIVEGKHFVFDTRNHNMKEVSDILYFDPYMQLRSKTLQKLLAEETQKESLTQELLWDFAQDYEDYAENFHEMLLEGCRGPPTQDLETNRCFVVLGRYWEIKDLTIGDFRQDLDRNSIFRERNILELVYCVSPSRHPDRVSPFLLEKISSRPH